MELSLLSGPDDAIARVACMGEISQSGFDIDETDPLEALLGEGAFARTLLLDLNKATFIDSSGVSWLLSHHNAFEDGGGALVLHSVPPVVQQVFDLLRLGSALRVARSETEAQTMASGETP